MWKRKLQRLELFLAIFIASASAAVAAPVSPITARQVAQGFLNLDSSPMNSVMMAGTMEPLTITSKDQTVLFHVVPIRTGGFIVIPGDDRIEPIVAFQASSDFSAQPDSPLYAMLARDMLGRIAYFNTPTPQSSQSATTATQHWKLLLDTATIRSTNAEPREEIDTVMVEPLVKSKWGQTTVGENNVYNYYTPHNYPCGCVATALSQILRYHEYDKPFKYDHKYTITVDDEEAEYYGFPGYGVDGRFVWDKMPLVPTTETDEFQRINIGILTYDAGISTSMDYAEDGSGANLYKAEKSLYLYFNYSNAYGYVAIMSSIPHDLLMKMINPSIDAKLPAILGISDDEGGHAVVADGYGYTNGTIYHHLNMGWDGQYDIWYNLPTITTSYDFRLVDQVIYDISPTGEGETIGGRVLDEDGIPVKEATVTVYPPSEFASSIPQVSGDTNEHGVFGLQIIGGLAGGYTLKTEKRGYSFPDTIVEPGTSIDDETCGNVWGVTIVEGTINTSTSPDLSAVYSLLLQ